MVNADQSAASRTRMPPFGGYTNFRVHRRRKSDAASPKRRHGGMSCRQSRLASAISTALADVNRK
jgi:hypothetical protein